MPLSDSDVNLALISIHRYYVIVDELVASIKKTEESLQRLKRLRKGADATAQSSSSNDVTDETKIRRQLFLDVKEFGKEVNMGCIRTLAVCLNFLRNLLLLYYTLPYNALVIERSSGMENSAFFCSEWKITSTKTFLHLPSIF